MTVIFGYQGVDGRALSGSVLAEGTKRIWGWETVPLLVRSGRGKPEFSGEPGKWLSISHSGGYCLCALSDDGPVGVDIEVVRPHGKNLPEKVMSEAELAAFDGSWEDFCRVWTLKESICKREDSPLWPPKKVGTPPDCPHASYSGAGWQAAVCCSGEPPEEICWLEELPHE